MLISKKKYTYKRASQIVLGVKIGTIVTWSIFMVFLFVLLEKMALVMGGSYHLGAGPDYFKYVAPHKVSQYIPFFGRGLGQTGFINHTPYWIMIGLIILSVIAFVGLLYPMYKHECGVVNRWHAITLIAIYSTLLLAGFILVGLFLSDSKSDSSLKYLPLILTLCEISFLFWSIRYYWNNQKMMALAAAGENTIETTTWKQFVDQIFINVPHQSNVLHEREDVFFDYNYYGKSSKGARRQYLRTKKRQALFHSFNPWLVVLIICLPTIAQQVVYLSYALVDKIMVVNFAPHAYSGNHVVIVDNLNIATQYNSTIQATIYGFVSLLASPAGLLFSYAFGRRNKREAQHLIGTSFNIGIILAVGVVFFGYFMLKPLINFQAGFGQSGGQEAKNMAFQFSRIFLFGFPIAMFSFAITSLMIAEGRAVSVFVITIVSALLNVLFNWILLAFTNLGIVGSAIANVLIYACTSSLAFLVLALDKSSWIRLHLHNMKWDPVLVRRYFSYGVVNFVNVVAGGIPIMIMVHLGSTAPIESFNIGGSTNSPTNGIVQAFAANSPWYSMMRAVVFGMIIGGRSITAYCYSGKLYQRMRRFMMIIALFMALWMLTAFLIIAAFGQQLIHIFIKDPKLSLHRFHNYLMISSAGIALQCVIFISVMFYQVTGQVYKALALTSMVAWLVQVPAFAIGWGFAWASNFGRHHSGYIFFCTSFIRSILVVGIAFASMYFSRHRIGAILSAKDVKSEVDDQINEFDILIKKHHGNINNLAKSTTWIPREFMTTENSTTT